MPGSAPSVPPRRIGILGGTFDPPHFGHLAAAREALRALDLDLVTFVVANDPWQKTSPTGDGVVEEVSPVGIRLAMVAAAIDGMDRVRLDDREVRRGGPSYTADTLAEYRTDHPDAELFVLVGSDVAPGLDTWVRPEEVRRHATIVVMERPGHEGSHPPAGWVHQVLDGSFPDLAGTDLRRMVATGQSPESAVPHGVVAVIAEYGLYGAGR